MAGHPLPDGMIPVAGYTAMFKDAANASQTFPVIALQAAQLPGDPPVAVCIGWRGRAFLATAPPAGLTLVAVVTSTDPGCLCA